MKVIDASVGFKALVTEADSAKAIQLVEDYRNGVTELKLNIPSTLVFAP
jgi:predicted nucleic acid-binding protein